ncbi:MAG: iron-sulfur cluster assembly scaffold protein [Candidatus Woesearchaeota archaeon]
MYSEKVLEHFRNPRHMGEIEKPDGRGRVGNPRCGDIMEITIKIGERKGEKIIEDIKVKTFGCVAAISSSDVLCDIVKGMRLEDAKKITNKDVLERLGEVPVQKKHCSVLAATALQNAIKEYESK